MRGLPAGVYLPDGVQAKEPVLPAVQDHGDGVPFAELCGYGLRHRGLLDLRSEDLLLECFPVFHIVAQDLVDHMGLFLPAGVFMVQKVALKFVLGADADAASGRVPRLAVLL